MPAVSSAPLPVPTVEMLLVNTFWIAIKAAGKLGARVGLGDGAKVAAFLLDELVESEIVDGKCKLASAKAGCPQHLVDEPFTGIVAAAAGRVAGVELAGDPPPVEQNHLRTNSEPRFRGK